MSTLGSTLITATHEEWVAELDFLPPEEVISLGRAAQVIAREYSFLSGATVFWWPYGDTENRYPRLFAVLEASDPLALTLWATDGGRGRQYGGNPTAPKEVWRQIVSSLTF